MSCERYEKALIEAAARGQSAEELAPKVREHLGECGACRRVLAAQQILQGAMVESIEQRVRVEVPVSLAAGVRARLGEERAARWGVRWQWAAVAAAMIFGLLLVRGSLERRTVPTTAIEIARVQPTLSIPDRKPESATRDSAKRLVSGNRRPAQAENRTFTQTDMKPLVREEQREAMESLVRKIRTGQLNPAVLQLDAKPETEELQVAPIQVEALETVSEDKELEPHKLANGQSRQSERSTR